MGQKVDETSMLINPAEKKNSAGETPPPTQPEKSKRNFIAIEGLRTLLCTQILIMHAAPVDFGYASNYFAQVYSKLLRNLTASVHCFVVISGFVTHLSARSRPLPSTPYDHLLYFGKKWIRLAPLYYLTYMLTLWTIHTIHQGIPDDKIMPAVLTFFGVQSLFTVGTSSGVYIPMAFIGHMWFVSTLMCSLFLYPFMRHMLRYFEIAGNPTRSLLALVGFLGFEVSLGIVAPILEWQLPGYVVNDPEYMYLATPTFHYIGYSHNGLIMMFTFLSGVLVAELAESMHQTWRDIKMWQYADLVCLLFLVFITPYMMKIGTFPMQNMALAFRPVQLLWCLSLACTSNGFFTAFFSHPSISSLGKYSYAAYALQFVVLDCMGYYYDGPPVSGWNPMYIKSVSSAMLTHIFLTWIFAAIATEYFEAPVVKLANTWIKENLEVEAGTKSSLPR